MDATKATCDRAERCRDMSKQVTLAVPSRTGYGYSWVPTVPLGTADIDSAGGPVRYIPPFDLIRRSVEISTVKGELRVNVSYEDFIKLLKMIIAGIEVNEDWYVKAYEDIGKAIKDGAVESAKSHFVDDGYFEGRLPFPINVDEKWYLQQYPDVAESVRRGVVASGQVHFEEDGYREGRLPFAM